MIGYRGGQDGAILAARDYALCPAIKFSPKPKQKLYNKSFIDLDLFGQDSWILASLFFCVFMDRDEGEVHKQKKNLVNIQPS